MDELFIEKTNGHYINKPSGLYLYPNINYLLAENVKADVNRMEYTADKLELNGNEVKYYAGTTLADSTQTTQDSLTTSTPWRVIAKSIELNDNHLVYYDSTKAVLPKSQFDPCTSRSKPLNTSTR